MTFGNFALNMVSPDTVHVNMMR